MAHGLWPTKPKVCTIWPFKKNLSNLESRFGMWKQLAVLVLDAQLTIRRNCFHFNLLFQVFDEQSIPWPNKLKEHTMEKQKVNKRLYLQPSLQGSKKRPLPCRFLKYSGTFLAGASYVICVPCDTLGNSVA